MLDALFSSDFIPHGHCFLWNPGIVWTQVVSNGTIALSYVAISSTLAYLVYQLREAIPYRGMYLAFGAFIVLCGITHMSDVLVIWKPAYWLDSAIRIATAVVSAATAAMLPSLVPNAAALARATRAAHERGIKLETAFRELGSVYQRTKELERLKSQFFANVSHELRTPIALVLGPIQKLLADGRLDAAAQRELAIALRNARVLQRQLDDLLLAARLEAGLRLEYADVDLGTLMREIGSNFEGLASDRNIRYAVLAPEPLRAELDPDKVQHIVLNLLSNAFKFTPANGRIRLELAAETGPDGEDRSVRITVADSGPGIDPADREAVFERFRQLDGAPTRKKAGVGLGLAIVKELVELHRGRVEVTQAPEGGAAFVVTLPARLPAGQRDDERRAAFGSLRYFDPAPVQLDQLFHDRQSESDSCLFPGRGAVELPETLEHRFAIGGVDARAAVGDGDPDATVLAVRSGLGRELEPYPTAGRGEFERIRQQVQHDMLDLVRIELGAQRLGRKHRIADVAVARKAFEVRADLPHQRPQVDVGILQSQTGLEAGGEQQVVELPLQHARVTQRDRELALRRRVQAAVGEQFLNRPEHQRDRRAQLVTDVGEELRLQPLQLLGPLVHGAQLAKRRLELDAALMRGSRRAGQRRGVGNQRRQHRGRCRRHDCGRDPNRAVEPVGRLPDHEHVGHVRDPAQHDERAEGQVHPAVRNGLTQLIHQIGQRAGDRNV